MKHRAKRKKHKPKGHHRKSSGKHHRKPPPYHSRAPPLSFVQIQQNLRPALNIKRKNGDYVGAVPVYGYKKAADNKNRLVVDEYAARVVKDIFKMRTEGYSADRIAHELNRLAVLSPREYKKDNDIPLPRNGYCDKENSKWSATTVIRILKDEIYTGKLIQGKYGKPNYKVKEYVKRNADEVFVTENAHEAIKALIVDLKRVYAAVDEQTALSEFDSFDEKWSGKYPKIAISWRANWANLSTYFKYPEAVRTLIYTTNAIEGFNRQLRKVTKNKSVFPMPQLDKEVILENI